jgi:hypothetical protein
MCYISLKLVRLLISLMLVYSATKPLVVVLERLVSCYSDPLTCLQQVSESTGIVYIPIHDAWADGSFEGDEYDTLFWCFFQIVSYNLRSFFILCICVTR